MELFFVLFSDRLRVCNTGGLAPSDLGLLWNLVVIWILLQGSGGVEAYIFRDPYCLHPESEVTPLRPSGRPITLVAYMGN